MLKFAAALAGGLALLLLPRLGRLRTRYDTAALHPLPGDAPADDPALVQRLTAWARDGMGCGATVLPTAQPHVPRPLAVAWADAAAADSVQHAAYRLAGYHQLDTRSRLGGLLYRVGVQLRPLLWCVPLAADAPWDDAWFAAGSTLPLDALRAWRPRRPTVIVVADATQVATLVNALTGTPAHGGHALRLVGLLPAGAVPPAMPGDVPVCDLRATPR